MLTSFQEGMRNYSEVNELSARWDLEDRSKIDLSFIRTRGLLIAAVALYVYLSILNSYFLADDFDMLLFAKGVLSSHSLPESLAALLTPFHDRAFIRTGGYILWVLDYLQWGLNPLGYHLTNVALHALNSILVGVVAENLSKNRKLGTIAGLLFAVHPLHPEAVAWLAGRYDVFCTSLYLLSLIVFIYYRQRDRLPIRYYFFSSILGLLAFLTKEMAITLPLIIVLYDLCFGERIHFSKTYLVSKVKLYWLFFGAAAVYLLWRIYLLGGIGGYVDSAGNPLLLKVQWVSLSKNLLLLLLRVSTALFIPLKVVVPDIISCILFGFLTTVLLGLISRKAVLVFKSITFWGLIWVLVTIIPVAMYLFISTDLRNSRYLYLPSVGFCIGLAYVLCLDLSSSTLKTLRQALIIFLIIFYALATMSHNLAWSEAGKTTLKITHQLTALYPQLPEGTHLYFWGIPNNINGAYVYLGDSHINATIQLLYNAPTSVRGTLISSRDYGWERWPDLSTLDLGRSDLVFEWIKEGHLIDFSQELKALLQERESLATQQGDTLPVWQFTDQIVANQWELIHQLRKSPASVDTMPTFTATGSDPHMRSPRITFSTLAVGAVEIKMRVSSSYQGPSYGELFWAAEADGVFDEVKHAVFSIEVDGQFHVYKLDLSNNLTWLTGGTVTQLRLDPTIIPAEIQIEHIKLIPYKSASTP